MKLYGQLPRTVALFTWNWDSTHGDSKLKHSFVLLGGIVNLLQIKNSGSLDLLVGKNLVHKPEINIQHQGINDDSHIQSVVLLKTGRQ